MRSFQINFLAVKDIKRIGSGLAWASSAAQRRRFQSAAARRFLCLPGLQPPRESSYAALDAVGLPVAVERRVLGGA
jgi:hypothetical protein